MDDSTSVRVSFEGESLRLDTAQDAEVICSKLLQSDVEILVLQGNTFGIEAAERVGQSLATQPKLREAHFKDLFTSRGRDEVPEALKHLLKGISDSGAKLTLLDLSDNAIGPIGAPSVIEFLNSPASENLEKLYVNNCGWGPDGSTSLSTTISGLRKLRELVCGRSRLENYGITNMSRALSELRGLEVLKFSQNGISLEGIKKLADALMANIDTIREIDLSDNTLKSEGSEVLAKFISRAKNLKIIKISDALLQNEGFSIICDALSKSPSLKTMDEASFEGNELEGQKIVDLIEITFANCKADFCLNLLDNEFNADELTRLSAIGEGFQLLIDDIEDDDDDYDDDDENGSFNNGYKRDDLEEGELEDDDNESDDDENDSDVSNGYVDLGNSNSDMREVCLDFLDTINSPPFDESEANSAFIQMISTGERPNDSGQEFQAVQILCEELGLMKSEETRKKKPIEREAIIYIGKRMQELPVTFKSFFEVVIKNNDELSCGKILFDKLEI